MSIINLKNVIPLGVLEDGIYPNHRTHKIGNKEQWVNTEESVNSEPVVFLYYRKSENKDINGHLFLYRTVEKIEIDLTNVTAYDNSALFKLSVKEDIKDLPIVEFESRNVNIGKYSYSTNWIKPTDKYLHFLVPMNRCVVSTYLNNVNINNLFSLKGVYTYDDKSWWIYTSNFTSDFEFSNLDNELLKLDVYVRELTAEDLNPVEQLFQQLLEHKNDKNNPHEVNKEHVGLGNVDNTSDINKPVSIPQQEFIDANKALIIGYFRQLSTVISNLKADLAIVENDLSVQKDKLNSKQSIYDKNLDTDDETVVGAINEILKIVDTPKTSIDSDSIKRIEIVSNLPETVEPNVLYFRTIFDEDDYKTITINSQPEDANIVLINSEGFRIEGIGSANITAIKGTKVQYIVSKEGYETKQGVIELTDNVDITMTLSVLKVRYKYWFSIAANPYDVTANVNVLDSENNTVYKTIVDLKGDGSSKEINLYLEKGYYIISITDLTDFLYEELRFNISVNSDNTSSVVKYLTLKETIKIANIVLKDTSDNLIDGVIFDSNSSEYLGYVQSDMSLKLMLGAFDYRYINIVSDGYKSITRYKLLYGIPTIDNIIVLEPEENNSNFTPEDYKIGNMEIEGDDVNVPTFTVN